MKLSEAVAACADYGCTLKKTDCGEYRVNLRGAGEESAYYTECLRDAVATARVMAGIGGDR